MHMRVARELAWKRGEWPGAYVTRRRPQNTIPRRPFIHLPLPFIHLDQHLNIAVSRLITLRA